MAMWPACTPTWGSASPWSKKTARWIANCGNCWRRSAPDAGSCTLVNDAIELAAEVRLAPAFHDCDPMNVVWHGNYFKIARCSLLQSYDYDYPHMLESGYLWPVVDARVKYVRPLLFNQPLRVRARIVEWENRLKIDYEIFDASSGERLTRATTIQVAVDVASREMLYQCPPVLWERLGVPAP